MTCGQLSRVTVLKVGHLWEDMGMKIKVFIEKDHQ